MVKTKSYQRINGKDFKNLILIAFEQIDSQKEILNDLNVFPVPDGDTGANMAKTLESGVLAISSYNGDSIWEIARMLSQGMLNGARGNSGVILSLLFRGIATAFDGMTECDGLGWANALESGVVEAYGAVDSPADGTILTVAKKCARASMAAAEEKNDFSYVLKKTVDAARRGVLETPQENPTLAKAGVVDAGGEGLLIILKAMLQPLNGDRSEAATPNLSSTKSIDSIAIEYTYCTELLVKKVEPIENTEKLKEYLKGVGGSLVFLDDGEIIKIHIHTNSPYDVLGRALAYGEYENVKIENMHTQQMKNTVKKSKIKPYGFVAVANGEGFSQMFHELGADEVIQGGQTMNPSVSQLLKAIETINAELVFVLPNNKNVVMSAKEALKQSGKNAVVIPTQGMTQGIKAMLSFDERTTENENTEKMLKAIGQVYTFYVTRATKGRNLDGLEIKENQLIAIEENDTLIKGNHLDELLDKIGLKITEKGCEIVSVYYGQNVTEQEAQKSLEVLGRTLVGMADVNLYNGGQPVYHYIISAE